MSNPNHKVINLKNSNMNMDLLYRLLYRLISSSQQYSIERQYIQMPIRINHHHNDQRGGEYEQCQSHRQDYDLLSHEQEWQEGSQQQHAEGYSNQQQQQRSQRQLHMLQTIKLQLVQNSLITQQQLKRLLYNNTRDQHCSNNADTHSSRMQQLYTIITHLAASLIQHNEHAQLIQKGRSGQIMALQQNIQTRRQIVSANDRRIMTALQMISPLTQQLSAFTHCMHQKNNTNSRLAHINSSTSNVNSKRLLSSFSNNPPMEIYRHFRHVYEFTQQLLNIFNQYEFTEEELLRRRADIIEGQIRAMEELMVAQAIEDQIEEQRCQQNQQHYQAQQSQSQRYNTKQHYSTHLPIQTQNYILSLRQQINLLHQTLIKNDQQFTQQIQKYNATIKELSQTIKSYQNQIAKIIRYQLKIEQLEKDIVIFREDKYKNQIIIDNMAKKIRNYEKDLKGAQAFISPQRKRLVSSPESRFSALNSKQSIINSVYNIKSMSTSSQQYKQKERIQQRVPRLQIGELNINY